MTFAKIQRYGGIELYWFKNKNRKRVNTIVLGFSGCVNKIQQNGWLKKQNLFSHGSGIKVLADSFSNESSFWLADGAFSLYLPSV